MVDVRDEDSLFQAAGGDVAIVMMGSVEQVAAFREHNKLPCTCLADADRVAYRAFGVPTGTIGDVAGPRVWLRGLRATLRAGLGKPVGDVRQLHGAFVIDSCGVVQYTHRPKSSVDLPDHAEIRDIFSRTHTKSDPAAT